MTTSFDRVIGLAAPQPLYAAAAILRFAEEVLTNDHEQSSSWVVQRAVAAASQEIRNAVDEGDDMNSVDAKVSAIRLRVGISLISDMLNADALMDEGDGSTRVETAKALRSASDAIFKLACMADAAFA